MTEKKRKLLEKLRAIAERQNGSSDKEMDHVDADNALLAYIGDVEVNAAFEDIDMWYA